jgi:hypothetical protein
VGTVCAVPTQKQLHVTDKGRAGAARDLKVTPQ